jgi:muramoyltetrapeptide carboxypeptidase LdcA involved in peptidoglycan recycling
LIKNNPKIICGYSDITALNTAIYTQTGLVTYLGPHFSSFGMKYGLDYTKEYFKKMLMQNESYEIISSKEWSDDLWFINQGDRKFILNPGMIGINEGKAEGVLVGGNISTFSLLCGTKYFPDLTDKILMLEAHSEIQKHHFDRLLQQIIQQPNFYRVRGILIGMFQNGSQMNYEDVGFIIKSKKELINIPVLSNVNFGHITPIATLPIGSFINFDSNETHSKINILN